MTERWAVVRDTNNDVGFFVKFIIEYDGDYVAGFSHEVFHIYEGTDREIERWFNWSLDASFTGNKHNMWWFEDIAEMGKTQLVTRMLFSVHSRMK